MVQNVVGEIEGGMDKLKSEVKLETSNIARWRKLVDAALADLAAPELAELGGTHCLLLASSSLRVVAL